MTFVECLKFCIRHSYSRRIARFWILINIGYILIISLVIGILYAIFFAGNVGLTSIVMIALAGGIIAWFGAMLNIARHVKSYGVGNYYE